MYDLYAIKGKIRGYEQKIFRLEEEAKQSGAIHRRDLYKHINRLKKELYEYKSNLKAEGIL